MSTAAARLGATTHIEPLRQSAVAFLIAGVAAIPLATIRVAGVAVSDLLLATSTLMALLLVAVRGRGAGPSLPAYFAATLVAAGGLLAANRADNVDAHMVAFAQVLFVVAVWQWTMRVVVDSRGALQLMMLAFVVGGAISGLAGVMQLAGMFTPPGAEIFHGRATGFAVHPNGQGGALAVAAGLGVGYLLGTRDRRWLLIAAVGAILAGLIVAGSLTGMASAMVAVLVLLVRRRVRPTALAGVAALLAVIYVGVVQLQTAYEGTPPVERMMLSSGQTGTSTVDTRIETYRAALDYIDAHPVVGAGLDADSQITYNGQTMTHNTVLLGWSQGGLLFLLGQMTAVCAAALWVVRAKGPEPLSEAILGGLVGAVTIAQTGPVMMDRYFWFPVALAFLLRARSQGQIPLRNAG